MIALITAALTLLGAILSEIFAEYSTAKQQQKAVDSSNANFQLILARALKKIGQGTGAITKPQDDDVDGELKGKDLK